MDRKTREKMSVDAARKVAGARSDYHLAQLLGVTKQLVSSWRKRGYIGFDYPEQCRDLRQSKAA